MRLRLCLLIGVLAGLFTMHGLAGHGVAGHAMAAESLVAEHHDHSGHSSARAGSDTSLSDMAAPLNRAMSHPMAGLCLTLLIGMVLFLRRGRSGAVLAAAGAGSVRRTPPPARARDPDPWSLELLSVRRC